MIKSYSIQICLMSTTILSCNMLSFRYRFRVISPGFTTCPISVSIDNHTLTMIASDGSPFRPVGVQSFVLEPGERLFL